MRLQCGFNIHYCTMVKFNMFGFLIDGHFKLFKSIALYLYSRYLISGLYGM